MQDSSMPPASPETGEAGGKVAGPWWARLAEDRVRSGDEGGVEWEGMRLGTHFQPFYCVRKSRCHGFEALARATDPAGAALRPDELFGATPASKRVLLDWTLRALHLRNFARVDPGERILFLNVHPEAAVNDARGSRELGDLIRYYGLVPKRVCVEILGASCTDEGLLREALATYRALGVCIAMDDFGSGSSNFDRMVRLRPDIVKIDRSLVCDAVIGETRARRVLAALIQLVREANASAAVKGIENEAQALAALEAKADFLQGFYFCAPQAGLSDEASGLSRLCDLIAGWDGRRLAIA